MGLLVKVTLLSENRKNIQIVLQYVACSTNKDFSWNITSSVQNSPGNTLWESFVGVWILALSSNSKVSLIIDSVSKGIHSCQGIHSCLSDFFVHDYILQMLVTSVSGGCRSRSHFFNQELSFQGWLKLNRMQPFFYVKHWGLDIDWTFKGDPGAGPVHKLPGKGEGNLGQGDGP